MLLLIGLGGNLGDVSRAFAGAARALAGRFRCLGRSGLWRTAPHGPPQGDYLNAALLLSIEVHPLQVLAFCQHLEAAAGRTRALEPRWGPRPLDLDLLVVPGLVLESPALTLPHPRLAVRRFVLAPGTELAPDWVHPRLHCTLAALAAQPVTLAQPCELVGPFPPVS